MSPHVIGLIASAVFLCRLLPQPIRLARTGVPDGLSPLAAMNAAIADFGWVLYGLTVGLVPVWAVAVLALLPSTWNAVLLRRHVTRRDLLGAGIWLALILGTWRADRLGVVLGVTVLVCQGPQVWHALRIPDLRGLAPATWWLAIVDASLWGFYGVVERDGALMAYGVVLLSSAVAVLVRLHVTRRAGAGDPLVAGIELAPAG